MSENPFFDFKNSGILSRQKSNDFLKELFRKSIHMLSALVPLFLYLNFTLTVSLLGFVLFFYIISETLRYKNINVPVISTITDAASRPRDKNRFVLGPVTLSIGILSTAFLYDIPSVTIGVFALAFGDGIASIAGRFFGKIKIPFTKGKTVCGSLACFLAIFISSLIFLLCGNFNLSINKAVFALIIATAGTFIELLPLLDFDNLFIPVACGGISQLIFTLCTIS